MIADVKTRREAGFYPNQAPPDSTVLAAESELDALEAAALRPELRVFARFMESHLRAHDDTRGDSWKSESIDWLIERLEEELSELRAARRRGNFDGIVDECADVANFAMMVATLADAAARVSADASKERKDVV